MLTKNQIKYIISLQKKKFRDKNNQFVLEGDKIVIELLNSNIKIKILFATENYLNVNNIEEKDFEITPVTEKEIKKISSQTTPQNLIAIAEIPDFSVAKNEIITSLSIVLDDIQDPGNLGTIIRIADWFGIENIFCSKKTVDAYNPKVVQATMGAILRVNIHYIELDKLFNKYTNIPNFYIFGTFLQGENIYKTKLESNGFIIIGNESKGIKEKYEKYIDKKIQIPTYSKNTNKTESLNAAVATGIVCSEFKKNV